MTDAAAEPNPLERTRKALKDGGLTQALAATEIGISDSALSQWLSGKYGGDEAAVEEKVERWLEARGEREELLARLPAPPDWADTPSSQRAIAGLTYAQMAGYIAVIHGGASVGKTMAARRHAGLRSLNDATGTGLARGIANKPGGLRGLSHTLGLASVFAGDKAVSAEHLRDAWRDLAGET